jgi:GT2 family glycosyltransferase
VRTLKEDEQVAAAGSKLLYPDRRIQHAGVVAIDDRQASDPLVARPMYNGLAHDAPETNEPRTYQALTAACLLVRKSAFEAVGGFDEAFWNGYEDVDLCFRLQEAGGVLVYQPESVVIHHEAQSGPERFRCVRENIDRLHRKWLNKVKPDFVIDSGGMLAEVHSGRIRPYKRKVSLPESPSRM